MDANTVIARKVHHGNKTFELFNLHFIDLNLTAIPLHLEWGVPVRGSSRSSIKLLSELAHTQLNYLSPFRTANLVSVCLFLHVLEGATKKSQTKTVAMCCPRRLAALPQNCCRPSIVNDQWWAISTSKTYSDGLNTQKSYFPPVNMIFYVF